MDYVYSELNDIVVNIEYNGVENETSKVLVDNLNRLIEVIIKKLPNKLLIIDKDGNTIQFDGSELKELDVSTMPYQETLDILNS